MRRVLFLLFLRQKKQGKTRIFDFYQDKKKNITIDVIADHDRDHDHDRDRDPTLLLSAFLS